MLKNLWRLLRYSLNPPKLLVKYDSPAIEAKAKLHYAKDGDAGLDLGNASGRPIKIEPGESIEVPTGLSLKIPDGYVGLIRCRSSAFAKRGLFVVHNSIDQGYVGPMFIHVWHPGIKGRDLPQVIEPWDRLGQIIIVPYLSATIVSVDTLPETVRGSSGFGSSGL